ncbi:MAG: ATP-binding protein, partial [Clostridia bacterium]|nr:ATP-binding protein [Clostridia bacterium]
MGYEVITDEKYHCLYKYAQPIQVPNRKMVGREKELRAIRAAMNRPELCNVLLLGEA